MNQLHPYPWRWAALAVVLVAEAMNLLDATIVQVAAPVIHADFGGPEAAIQWFSNAYTLPFAVLLITGGRLGDIVGRARIFTLGVMGFVLASLACALAPSNEVLIAARAIQGAAAALVIPQTFGLIRAMFAGAELPRALGTIGPVMALSAILGPVLGGFLTHADLFGWSWRSVFLVNLPLGLGVLAGARILCEDRSFVGSRRAAIRALLVQIEPGVLRGRMFPAALATSLLAFAVMSGLTLAVELHLQLDAGTDVLTAGLTLVPLSIGMGTASWIGGSMLVPRFGPKLMLVGLPCVLLGLLASVAVQSAFGSGYPWPLLLTLGLCGIGFGLFTVPFFSTALSNVQPHETGSASGMLNAVQEVGTTVGVALLGSLLFAMGFGVALLVGCCLVGLACLSAALMLPRPSSIYSLPYSLWRRIHSCQASPSSRPFGAWSRNP
jgi:MFS family permease